MSELGDLTETAANSERSNGQNIWVDVQDGDTTEHLDRALTFLVQRLKQHTAPVKGSGTSSLDPTLLGAGLKTSWQLQLPAVEDLKTQEILKRHSKEIREALLNEGAAAVRRLFDGYEPDQGWKQPIQPEGFDTLANLITVQLPALKYHCCSVALECIVSCLLRRGIVPSVDTTTAARHLHVCPGVQYSLFRHPFIQPLVWCFSSPILCTYIMMTPTTIYIYVYILQPVASAVARTHYCPSWLPWYYKNPFLPLFQTLCVAKQS